MRRSSDRVRRSSVMVRRSSVRSASTCCKAGLSSILGSAPHGGLLLLSEEAMKIQEDGPRQMVKDE